MLAPHQKEILKSLRDQSTWRLVVLTFITYGVYAAHYIRRQTGRINQHLKEDQRIPDWYVSLVMIFSYGSLVLFIASLSYAPGHPLEKISMVSDGLWGLLVLIWAFFARRRMNYLLSAEKKTPQWFKGLWTFLFCNVYFNYKVNCLNDGLGE